MDKLLQKLIAALQEKKNTLSQKKITAGFDGFVDTIAKIIRAKEANGEVEYFKSLKQFNKYLGEKTGSSFSLETEVVSTRIGGNMPLLANALGHLGIPVNCIGALDHPVFAHLSPYCRQYSFAEPGTSTNYEFGEHKMMLGQMLHLNTTKWEGIKNSIGLDTLASLYRNSDLIAIVNWSEIDASTDIWKGLLRDVLPGLDSKPLMFVDLSDFSKRMKLLPIALELLKEFSQYSHVTLGLNNNEARLIYQVLYGQKEPEEFKRVGEKIYEKIGIETLVLHSSKEAIGYNAAGMKKVKTFFVKKPATSTGAGDNFNAGFCTAALLGFDMELSLLLGNAVAGSYVSTGKNHDLEGLIKYVEHAAENL